MGTMEDLGGHVSKGGRRPETPDCCSQVPPPVPTKPLPTPFVSQWN